MKQTTNSIIAELSRHNGQARTLAAASISGDPRYLAAKRMVEADAAGNQMDAASASSDVLGGGSAAIGELWEGMFNRGTGREGYQQLIAEARRLVGAVEQARRSAVPVQRPQPTAPPAQGQPAAPSGAAPPVPAPPGYSWEPIQKRWVRHGEHIQ